MKIRKDLIRLLEEGNIRADEYYFKNLKAPPLLSFLPMQDIAYLNKLARSIKLSAKIDYKYSEMDKVMEYHGFIRMGRGTNRACYRHLENKFICIKVAVDDIGIRDNPREMINQDYLYPFVCKIFEVDPTGTVALVERVNQITNRDEFMSIAPKIFDLIRFWFTGKYIMEDIGSKYFMNWGTRFIDGCPVLLDYPYMYELDYRKIYCQKPDLQGVCGGEIDYDDGYNALICTKCGAVYRATELSKDLRDSKLLIDKEAEKMKIKVRIRHGNDIQVVEVDDGKRSIEERYKNAERISKEAVTVIDDSRARYTYTPETGGRVEYDKKPEPKQVAEYIPMSNITERTEVGIFSNKIKKAEDPVSVVYKEVNGKLVLTKADNTSNPDQLKVSTTPVEKTVAVLEESVDVEDSAKPEPISYDYEYMEKDGASYIVTTSNFDNGTFTTATDMLEEPLSEYPDGKKTLSAVLENGAEITIERECANNMIEYKKVSVKNPDGSTIVVHEQHSVHNVDVSEDTDSQKEEENPEEKHKLTLQGEFIPTMEKEHINTTVAATVMSESDYEYESNSGDSGNQEDTEDGQDTSEESKEDSDVAEEDEEEIEVYNITDPDQEIDPEFEEDDPKFPLVEIYGDPMILLDKDTDPATLELIRNKSECNVYELRHDQDDPNHVVRMYKNHVPDNLYGYAICAFDYEYQEGYDFDEIDDKFFEPQNREVNFRELYALTYPEGKENEESSKQEESSNE